LRKQGADQRAGAWRRAGMLLIVIATFLAVIFPYIQTSKRIYGQYFYNVNSTFVIWCDTWPQAWEFLSAHGDKDQWRSLPPEQLPSFSKYWREHSISQMAWRLTRGSWNQVTQNAMAIGYYKLAMAFLVAGVALSMRDRARTCQLVAENRFPAAFCILFFCGYFVLYAWYQTLVADTRFILALFLPSAFAASLFLLRLAKDRTIPLAGRRLPFEQFFPALLIALSLVDVFYNAKFFF
jgi:hypothetical protein